MKMFDILFKNVLKKQWWQHVWISHLKLFNFSASFHSRLTPPPPIPRLGRSHGPLSPPLVPSPSFMPLPCRRHTRVPCRYSRKLRRCSRLATTTRMPSGNVLRRWPSTGSSLCWRWKTGWNWSTPQWPFTKLPSRWGKGLWNVWGWDWRRTVSCLTLQICRIYLSKKPLLSVLAFESRRMVCGNTTVCFLIIPSIRGVDCVICFLQISQPHRISVLK